MSTHSSCVPTTTEKVYIFNVLYDTLARCTIGMLTMGVSHGNPIVSILNRKLEVLAGIVKDAMGGTP